jgi:hypothetical protein
MISVLLLSLPSVYFAILHALYTPSILPEFLDLAAAWTLTLTGMIGGATTMAAVVIAVFATFLNHVSHKAKVVMWVFVSCSLLACFYLASVRI